MFSKSILLITVTGRKSGKKYTTPVNYLRRGDELTIISLHTRTWWRNLRGGREVTIISDEIVVIAVAAVATDLLNLRPHVVLVAEDLDDLIAVQNPAPQGVLGLIADEQHRGAWITDVVFEVMQHASCFAHA